MKLGQKYFEAARKAHKSGRLEEAQWLYECSLLHVSRYAFTWLRYAEVLWRQKKHRNAIAAADRAIQSTLERKKPKQEILCLAHDIKGSCFFKLRQWKETEAEFRGALEIEPAWHRWNMLGRALYYQDRDEEATECFRQSIELDPDNEEGLCLLAFMIADENPDEAEKHLRRAIELDPDFAEAWTDLGHLLASQRRGTIEETRHVLEKAIELMPDAMWSRLYYANILRHLDKNNDAAAEQYEKAFEIASQDSAWRAATAGGFLGDFLSAEHIDPDRAEVLLRRALEIDPDEDSYFFLGRHLWRCERDDEARPFLEKAAALGHKRAAELLSELEVETD